MPETETGHAHADSVVRTRSRGYYTPSHIDFRERRSQLFAGLSSSDSCSLSLVAGLYKFRPAILSVFLRPRDESFERDIKCLSRREKKNAMISPVALRYGHLRLEEQEESLLSDRLVIPSR